MMFFKIHPHCRYLAAVFTLFVVFFAPKKADAQCNCAELFNIGTNSASDNTLNGWIASHPTFPQSSLSGPCLRVFGTLHIDRNYTFTGLTVTMMPGSRIIVEPGFSLTITGNATLRACTTPPFNRLWRGITVKEFSSLFISTATIKDAITALDMQDNTTLQLHRCNFDKNVTGVFFAGDSTDPDNSGFIKLVNPGNVSRCSFTCFGTLLKDENGQTIANRSKFGIDLHNCDFFNVGVNAPGNANINSFFNQETCISAFDSEGLGVFNTVMTNINSADAPIGVGIYTNNCENVPTLNHNKISKVQDGIRQDLSDLSMINNTIDALNYGVACQMVKNRFVKIFGLNSITSKNLGILISDVNSSGIPDFVEIAGNKLIQGGYEGIAVYFCTAPLWIHDNPDIEATLGSGDGFQLQNCSGKGLIRNNVVKAPGDSGFELLNVNGYQFVQNTINGGGGGVFAMMAENNLYCCTLANGCASGTTFYNSCTDTRLWNTEYNGNGTGLVQIEKALLKPQENHGNKWNISPSSGTDALYFGDDDPNSLIQFNLHRISMPFKPSLNTNTIVIKPNGQWGNSDNWHKLNNLYDPSCSVPTGGSPSTYCGENANIQFLQSPWDGFSAISPVDSKAIQNESGLNAEFSALKWLQQQYLYKKTKYNTTFRNSDASLSTFYTSNQNSVLGKLEAIESGYRNLFLIPSSSLAQYNSLRAQSLTISGSIAQIDLQLQDTTGNLNSSLQIQRLNLVQSAVSMNDQIQQIEASAKLAQFAQAATLFNDNSAISTTDTWQTNEKTVFGILLQAIASDVAISASQKSTVESIAAQCPIVGGRGVIWARAIKKRWDSTPDDNSCFSVSPVVSQFVQDRSKSENLAQSEFRVFPSPTSDGYFNFEMPKSAANGGTFQLMDVSGKFLLNQKLPANQTSNQFEVSALPNGMYFYFYKGIEGDTHSGKIIVQND